MLRNSGPSRFAPTRRTFLIASGSLATGLPLSVLQRLARAATDGQPAAETVPALAVSPGSAADNLLDEELRERVQALLEATCDWVMTLDLGSGTLKAGRREPKNSIWVNGNLTRVLLSGHKVLNRPDYLAEALRWLDHLADQQQRITTSTGQEAGCWTDFGRAGELYLADTGTALTAMALGYKLAQPERQERYLAAMERFARFVRFGCSKDPQGRGRATTTTWLIDKGKDRGALGCGYYRGHLSTAPYIISTAICRSEFFCLLQSINNDPELTPIVEGAVRWILAQRLPSGEIPYIIDGIDPKRYHWPLDTMTYCSEGLVAAYLHQDDSQLRRHIAKQVKPSVEWLVRTQNENGSWGEMGSQDQQRSPGCVTLLAWYYRTIDADPRVARSIRKYCRFLLDPANQGPYGYKRLVRTTGFIGLVLAELLKQGVTFQ